MDQGYRAVSGNVLLSRLVTNALGEIEQLGYSRRSRDRYRTIWQHLIEFAHQQHLGDELSASLATRFVKAYRAGDADAIVEWFRGSGLRPFLAPLDDAMRRGFLAEYAARVGQAYPPRHDGRVLLRFPRLFIVAIR